MRLKRLDIAGFGCLRGAVDLEAGPAKLGLVLERNEAGKSTLVAAIAAALFGLDGDKRHFRKTLTEVERFRPWQGGPYQVSLTVEVGGEILVVDRDFERGEVRVLSGGRDVTPRYVGGGQEQVGEGLTGLSLAQFRASCLALQGELVWDDPTQLSEALQRVADTQGGESTAASAIGVLQAALEKYDGLTLANPGHVDTEIKRCEGIVQQDRKALAELESRRAEQTERLDRIARDEAADQSAQLHRLALDLRRAQTDLQTQQQLLGEDDRRRAKIAELEAKLAEDPTLLSVDASLVVEIRRTSQAYQRVSDRIGGHEATLARLNAALAEHEKKLSAQALARPVGHDDAFVIRATAEAITDLDRAEQRNAQSLEGERQALMAKGVDVNDALSRAEQFDQLVEVDRKLLASASSQRMSRMEQSNAVQDRLTREKTELAAAKRQRTSKRRPGWILVAMSLILAVVAFFLHEQIPLRVLLQAVIVSKLGIIGSIFLWRSYGSASKAEIRLASRVEECEAEYDRIGNEAFEAEQEFVDLARRIGLDVEELEARYDEWCRIESSVRALSVYTDRKREFDTERARIATKAASFWSLFGDEVDLQDLPERERRARDAFTATQAIEQNTAQKRQVEAELQKDRESLTEAKSNLREAFARAGVKTEGIDDIDEITHRFEERRQLADQLFAIQETQLPSLRNDLFNAARREQTEAKIAALETRIAELRPRFDSRIAAAGRDAERLQQSLTLGLREEDYNEARNKLEAQGSSRQEANKVVYSELLSFRREYEAEAPRLRARLAEHELALDRALNFRDAVSLARDTLGSIGKQTHRVWGAEISSRANDLLATMGSEARELGFDDDLEISLRQAGQRLTGEQARRTLSAGALDLVHLACRLAIASFLSEGEELLPLVLDDPFANFDDERMRVSMQVLIDAIAPRQQVMLLACQPSRYDWARARLTNPNALVAVGFQPAVS